MKKSGWFPSKYMRPTEVPEPRVLRLDKVLPHEFTYEGKKSTKPVAFFSDAVTGEKIPQGLVLNWTLFDKFVDVSGVDDSDHMPGHVFEVFVDALTERFDVRKPDSVPEPKVPDDRALAPAEKPDLEVIPFGD